MSIFTRILFAFHTARLQRLQAARTAQLRTGYTTRRAPVIIDAPAIARQQFREKSHAISRVSHGFSLIELMIVVGILGILVALAIPAYSGYSAKAAASEAVQLAHGAETAMIDTFQESSNWPLSNAASGYTPQTGKYSGAVVDGVGNIAVTFTQNAPAPLVGKILYLQAYLGPDNQTILFQCGNAPVPLFDGVAGTLLGSGGPLTTVPDQYMSKVCRT